jgi:hypothetical protein
MPDLRAQVGEVYETNAQCDVQEVVLVVGPVPDGYLQKHTFADRYHLCARLFVEEGYRHRDPTIVLNDGELEHWYHRIS